MSQQINLFNPVFLKQDKEFSARALGQAMLLMACGLVLLFVIGNNRIADTRSQASSTSAKLEAARNQLVKVLQQNQPVKKNPNLDADIRKMEARVAGNREVLSFLQKGDFGSHVAYSEVMRALARKTMPGVWLTRLSLNDTDNGIDIGGQVLQGVLLPAYIKSLSSEAAFKGHSFSSVLMRAPANDAASVDAKGGAAAPLVSVEFTLSTGESTSDLKLANGTNGANRQ